MVCLFAAVRVYPLGSSLSSLDIQVDDFHQILDVFIMVSSTTFPAPLSPSRPRQCAQGCPLFTGGLFISHQHCPPLGLTVVICVSGGV